MLDILLIDDELEIREPLEEMIRDAGHTVVTAADGAAGLEQVQRRVFDVVISDVRLPQVDGLSVFRDVRKRSPSTDVILMTAFAEVGEAVAALKEGAYDYLVKPFDIDELLVQLRRIDENRALRRELEKMKGELSGRNSRTNLVGESPPIRRVVEMVRMVASSDVPVLITGETGTGKEVVARMIHEQSARRDKPFVVVNCGALAENLIEAELFGHERGAFTGAVKKREGRFKAADGGTLFLDEVAELPQAAQAKLLRVLQEGTFEPIGTNTPVKVDVRILSATHRNLPERIKTNHFREDLFYRINVIQIQLPALRERPGDLPLLLRHFIQRFLPAGSATVPSLSPAVWATLAQYPFPGNVRELSHAVEHALVLSGGREIELHHLPPTMTNATTGGALIEDATLATVRPLQVALREFEQQYLLRVLKVADGKRMRAAEMLGISRKTLWEKLRNGTAGAAEHHEDETRAFAADMG
ncbi:MAG TPA: sigma-54 dependent transcriptional regulator [Polyangia bacterium]|nr:sigma-54 dependent transcriptional regulator [Polyangia bacterium]